MKFSLIVFCFFFFAAKLYAQSTFQLQGAVRSEKGEPLSGVNIRIYNSKARTQTDDKGFYTLRLSQNKVILTYSRLGFKSLTLELGLLEGISNVQDVILSEESRSLEEVQISGKTDNIANFLSINAGNIRSLPSVSGNFESILKALPGVSANNELSSQYSVRGGNFDENLVYLNDVEIYRPLLVRNGQQEGLSFINPELASSVNFSAGGFESKYGDKLSSVLDVKYLRPDSLALIISPGLSGNSATLKLPNKNNFLLAGIRFKNNRHLLNKQETRGSYQPNFADYQLLYSRDVNKKLTLSLLADYNLNNFNLEPASRETTFGSSTEVLRLRVDYRGKEADRYESLAGAFTLLYKPRPTLNFKWINSVSHLNEQERFTIEGQYVFDELETGLAGSEMVRANRGIGASLEHARNRLKTTIYSSELRAYKQFHSSFLLGGLRLQQTRLNDNLNEFSLIDSAGYTLPNQPGPLLLSNLVQANNTLRTNQVSAFIQNTFQLSPKFTLDVGLRGNYNSYTNEFLLSPRLSAAWKPAQKNDLTLRLAAGLYDQPPFYREFRNFDGTLNPGAKAQRSAHFLAGADYSFYGLGTRLRFSSEIYYKLLNRLTPYKIENLRIRYYAGQHSKGYAAGADFSLSGEFVPELESSFRLSLMKSSEDIAGDFYLNKNASGNIVKVEPGYLKRPSDQRVNLSVFFQDRLLNSPAYKVHLNLLYGSALPVGPPGTGRYRDVFKIPAYKRVDIGFSRNFLDPRSKRKPLFLQRNFAALTAYAEVFNLLDISNTVSYLWIKDVSNNQYAIPNYLTPRLFSFRLIASLKYN